MNLANHRPGGLGELTLWERANRDEEFTQHLLDDTWTKSIPGAESRNECPLTYAAPRWFTVAQAAANLSWHPMVRSLDPDKLSYYAFRDATELPPYCPLVILSEVPHFKGVEDTGKYHIISQKTFVIAGHDDRPIVVARAWVR